MKKETPDVFFSSIIIIRLPLLIMVVTIGILQNSLFCSEKHEEHLIDCILNIKGAHYRLLKLLGIVEHLIV